MASRRDLLKALSLLTPVMAASGAGLQNIVITPDSAKITKADFGTTRVYFDGSTGMLSSMTAGSVLLNPGAEPHPAHQHPEEEFVLITRGKGEISVQGQITPVSAGAMMYCAGNKMHGIKNTGKNPLEFYFFKWKA